MSLTVQVNVSRKGVVVSNHDGSASFDTVNQAAQYMARYAWQQYGEAHVIAKTTIYDNYARKEALTDWFAKNPICNIVVPPQSSGSYEVQIDWRLKF